MAFKRSGVRPPSAPPNAIKGLADLGQPLFASSDCSLYFLQGGVCIERAVDGLDRCSSTTQLFPFSSSVYPRLPGNTA